MESCETSKRLHRLHLSLYLWDCICWNSVSNFLVIFLCSQAKLETDILINLATNIVMIYALLCTRNLSPIFSSGKVGTHIFRLWTFMPVYTDFEHRCWWSLTYSVTHILTFFILQIEEMAFSVFFCTSWYSSFVHRFVVLSNSPLCVFKCLIKSPTWANA